MSACQKAACVRRDKQLKEMAFKVVDLMEELERHRFILADAMDLLMRAKLADESHGRFRKEFLKDVSSLCRAFQEDK